MPKSQMEQYTLLFNNTLLNNLHMTALYQAGNDKADCTPQWVVEVHASSDSVILRSAQKQFDYTTYNHVQQITQNKYTSNCKGICNWELK
jgi:hypothetical protein